MTENTLTGKSAYERSFALSTGEDVVGSRMGPPSNSRAFERALRA